MNPFFSTASLPGSLIGALLYPVSFVWLAILGEWRLLAWSTVVGVAWILFAGKVNSPSRILVADHNSKVRRILHFAWAIASHILTLGLTAWCFFFVADTPKPDSYIPALMLGYVTAIASIYVIVEKNRDETTGWDTLLNAQVLYAALVICFFAKTTLGTALTVMLLFIALKPCLVLTISARNG